MICRVVETTDGLRALRQPWTTLVDAGPTTSPFLTWEWMWEWWLAFGAARASRRLAVLTVWAEGDLVAALPTFVERRELAGGLSLRTLRFLGLRPESSDHLDVIAAKPDAASAMAAMVDHVRARMAVDRVWLDALDEDGTLARVLPAVAGASTTCCRVERRQSCPYVPMADSWSDYRTWLSPRFRQTLARRTRRLFETGDVTFDWVARATDVAPAIREVFELHRRRFEHRRARTGFVFAARGDFHIRASQALFPHDRLRVFRLRHRERTIAVLYCLRYRNRLSYYQAGLDPGWTRRGVGTVLMGQVLRHAHEHGYAELDLLRGMEPHKFRWTRQSRPLVAIDLGLTRRGRLVTRVAGVAATVRLATRRRPPLADPRLRHAASRRST